MVRERINVDIKPLSTDAEEKIVILESVFDSMVKIYWPDGPQISLHYKNLYGVFSKHYREVVDQIDYLIGKWFSVAAFRKYPSYLRNMVMKCIFFNIEDLSDLKNPYIFNLDVIDIKLLDMFLAKKALDLLGFTTDSPIGVCDLHLEKVVVRPPRLSEREHKLIRNVMFFWDYQFRQLTIDGICDEHNSGLSYSAVYKAIQQVADLAGYKLRSPKYKAS